MLKHARTTIILILFASSLSIGGTLTAAGASKLPDPTKAGFAEKLYRLDCGHSLQTTSRCGPPATCWQASLACRISR
jgi:hypothetical protein